MLDKTEFERDPSDTIDLESVGRRHAELKAR
jgi:hypothetical protein